MSLTITAAQRDALYDQILDRLSGIGDIELAIQASIDCRGPVARAPVRLR